MNKTLRTKEFPSGIVLDLVQGDIIQADVEGIVNPANQWLAHGGGLAGLLSQKAGGDLDRESAAWVKKYGPVSHAKPAYTGAGRLPFKFIIHAVGPVWGSGDEASKLARAVAGSLELADHLGLISLALPAISTGIFGYPLREAAAVILSELVNYAREKSPGSLQRLQLVLYDDRSAAAFTAEWERSGL
jgi:O-acetyl-ADP-ribose deacetylase (regulator of RNase III)